MLGVSVQPPAATVPTQVAAPSLTVTLPVGVPTGLTVKVTAMPCPTADGFGVWPVIVVVVPARFTVCAAPTDVLPLKLASPA